MLNYSGFQPEVKVGITYLKDQLNIFNRYTNMHIMRPSRLVVNPIIVYSYSHEG